MRYKERFLFLFFFSFMFCFSGFSQDKPQVKLGGALRFNYNYSDWKEGHKKRGGDFGFDLFRLNVDATYKKLFLNGEYRFYPSSSGGGMLKTGYVGYRFDEHRQIQLGLTGVPFGIKPYTSNSYFFNINYYLGLEDDADMGIKYLYQNTHWTASLAFFKNADELDFGSDSEISPNRYGYDVAGRNKEVNQANAQVVYRWGSLWKQQIGASGEFGGLYNLDTQEMGTHAAWGVHYVLDYGHWNLKAQYTSYRMKPKNAVQESREVVAMGAYGSTYLVAAKADTYSASLAYTFGVNKGFLDTVTLYNDFSMMHKRISGFKDSYQNITGCLLGMGPVYTYVDCALGKNQAWLGGDWNTAFAQGTDSKQWHTRLNVNIGYYF